jgi:hypothetical protein
MLFIVKGRKRDLSHTKIYVEQFQLSTISSENLNSDCKQLLHFQQNEQPPLTSNHCSYKRP